MTIKTLTRLLALASAFGLILGTASLSIAGEEEQGSKAAAVEAAPPGDGSKAADESATEETETETETEVEIIED